jgi:hypothetical protein
MIVWVWDAQGPDRGEVGVSDNEKRARKRAKESLLCTGASEVLVEQAYLQSGAKTLNYGYARTGHGWRGRRTPRGRVIWRKLVAAGNAPSADRL